MPFCGNEFIKIITQEFKNEYNRKYRWIHRVILKINDTTGEIEEVATKTVNGELIDPSRIEDRIGGLNK